MILAPYKFLNHGSWQGTSHPLVFQNEGQFYMGHQGRPGVDKYFMVLHVRKIFWTESGWHIVSPERFAGTEQSPVKKDELVGSWEKIQLDKVTRGLWGEQGVPDFQEAATLTLNADGTLTEMLKISGRMIRHGLNLI